MKCSFIRKMIFQNASVVDEPLKKVLERLNNYYSKEISNQKIFDIPIIFKPSTVETIKDKISNNDVLQSKKGYNIFDKNEIILNKREDERETILLKILCKLHSYYNYKLSHKVIKPLFKTNIKEFHLSKSNSCSTLFKNDNIRRSFKDNENNEIYQKRKNNFGSQKDIKDKFSYILQESDTYINESNNLKNSILSCLNESNFNDKNRKNINKYNKMAKAYKNNKIHISLKKRRKESFELPKINASQ